MLHKDDKPHGDFGVTVKDTVPPIRWPLLENW